MIFFKFVLGPEASFFYIYKKKCCPKGYTANPLEVILNKPNAYLPMEVVVFTTVKLKVAKLLSVATCDRVRLETRDLLPLSSHEHAKQKEQG